MKNVRIRVIQGCNGYLWRHGVCEGRKQLLVSDWYEHKGSAVRGAKAMAKRIGIKYDPEIIKQHGC